MNLEAAMAHPLVLSADAVAHPPEMHVVRLNDVDESLPVHEEVEIAADDLTRLFGGGPRIAVAAEVARRDQIRSACRLE